MGAYFSIRGFTFCCEGLNYVEINSIFVVENQLFNVFLKPNTMKKILTMVLLTAMVLIACEKDGTQATDQKHRFNRVIVLPEEGKTGNSEVILALCVGHDGKTCKGCVWEDGMYVHVNCVGEGNLCQKMAAVQLQQIETDVIATTTDTFDLTSEDFFLMPDRSLSYKDEKGNDIFLNIPEQMVYRNRTTQQFTFTGLFFSESAAYSNN